MKKVIALFVGGLLLLACGIGVVTIATGDPHRQAVRSTPTTYAPPPSKGSAPAFGDETVHVGEDVPPGTYRLREAASAADNCYWAKSNDAEGRDIIANDIGSAGRLQVTLKKGQWFESRNCGIWVKK